MPLSAEMYVFFDKVAKKNFSLACDVYCERPLVAQAANCVLFVNSTSTVNKEILVIGYDQAIR